MQRVSTNLGEHTFRAATDGNGPYVSFDTTTDMIEVAFLEDFITALRDAAEEAKSLKRARP